MKPILIFLTIYRKSHKVLVNFLNVNYVRRSMDDLEQTYIFFEKEDRIIVSESPEEIEKLVKEAM